ncbi:MAG TPA: trigger factor, partial [Planctomycetaceae bacterium]|nr:trigger factor [Planctomycetaceae bacterium]
MSADGEETVTSEGEATAVESAPEEQEQTETVEERLELKVNIENIGPCRKHVSVTVPESDIQRLRGESLDEFSEQAEVPGFRIGRVPRSLLEKRFKSELSDQVKQRVLLQSLEQMSDDNEIDPINQPDIDVESLDIPDSGDFCYEFDVEVRPDFDVPDYKGFEIDRPSGDVSDDEFEAFKAQFLESYSTPGQVERAAESGDSVVCNLKVTHGDNEIRDTEDVAIRIRPSLQFQDAEIEDFESLMTGVSAGDSRSIDVSISVQSSVVEMRGETVTITFDVTSVRAQELPELDKEFLDQFNCDSEEELNNQIRESLDRQVEYQQRQTAREQVLEK